VQLALLVILLLELVSAMSISSVERFVQMLKVHATTLLGCAVVVCQATCSIVCLFARKVKHAMLIVAPDRMIAMN